MEKTIKQIKSKGRVRKFGEVFTAEREVKAMCDLIPPNVWENIGSTFLEPACGNGNFVVEILARKYDRCADAADGLTALASVVGIDIQADNVAECRRRMLTQFADRFPGAPPAVLRAAETIAETQIICGDSLEIMKNLE